MSTPIVSGTPLQVIDPRGERTAGRLLFDNGDARLAPLAEGETETPRLAIGPGWVDLHAHVFDGSTQISVAPDRVGLDQGVHLLADAGSAGQQTIAGFERYVAPTARTRVVSWLNIGSAGLVNLRETADSSLIDVDATVAAAQARPEFVRGIKVRSSGAIVGNMGLTPLQLGRLVARTCGLPLLVHIGEAPPLIDDVLDLLDEGDTITHCFHGKTGSPWLPDGTPAPALRRALDRGVRLDVGHGAASLDIDVARAAIGAGHTPHTVSTDIHVRNLHGPVYSLATVMTKMLDCGMMLPAVVEAVTYAARETLGMQEDWLAADNTIRHATVFEVGGTAPPNRTYVDSVGKPVHPKVHLQARGIVSSGAFTEIAPV